MLKAYFDESGIHEGSAVTAIGGYVGTKTAWEALEPKWGAILSPYQERGIKFFHMAESLAQEGQFGRIDKPNTNYLITQLAQILGEPSADLEPFFSAVVIEDWKAVVRDEAFLLRFPHPIDLCFENLVQNLWRWAKQSAGGEIVCPMFAYHREFAPRMAEIGRVYGAQDWYKTVLGPIAFGYPEQVIPLQGADLLAHQMNQDIAQRAFGPFDLGTGETKALRWATGGKFIRGNWFDAIGLELTIKRFRETGKI